ncbi:hypothetical protein GCM10023238_24030 [Streptomyces heliomycini]
MLAKARQILVSELALAENTIEDKAEAPARRGCSPPEIPGVRLAVAARSPLSAHRNAAVPDDVMDVAGAAACPHRHASTTWHLRRAGDVS